LDFELRILDYVGQIKALNPKSKVANPKSSLETRTERWRSC